MINMGQDANLGLCQCLIFKHQARVTYIANILRLPLQGCKLFWRDDRHGGVFAGAG